MITTGFEPRLECSSRGDKRFSAMYAVVDGRTIEQHYQAAKVFSDGRTGLTIREAKGKRAVNAQECSELYSKLWDKYFEQNPELIDVILPFRGFSDIFGQQNHVCQAKEIYRIWLREAVKGCYESQNKYAHLIKNKNIGESFDIDCSRSGVWGNPYSHLPKSKATYLVGSREEAVVQHKWHLAQLFHQDKLDLEAIAKLHNKRLGCYCFPSLCHCSTLLELAEHIKNTQ